MISFFFILSLNAEKKDTDYTNIDGELSGVPRGLTKFVIQRTVKTIGQNCFENSTQTLETIDTKEALLLMRILPKAFAGCIKLKKVDFSNSKLLWSIQESAFENSGIEEVLLPVSLKSIGDFAFHNTKITNISIPDSVFWIGVKCFYNTPLVEVNFTKESCLAVIKFKAFAKTKLTHFYVPKNVASIGGGCFARTPLTNLTLSKNNVHLTYNHTMYNKNMTKVLFVLPTYTGSIEINSNAREIAPSAFEYCQVTEINLANIEMIGTRAFYHSGLTQVSIPASVRLIGESSFEGCSALRSLRIKGSNIVIGKNSFYHTGISCNVKIDPSLIYTLIQNGISINSFYKCHQEEHM